MVIEPKPLAVMQHAGNCACLDCGQAITTPLCPACIAEQMRAWHADFTLGNSTHSSSTLSKLFDEPFVTSGGGKCIKCNASFGLCSHCFTKALMIEVFNEKPQLISSYLDTFNYELR
ncbi:MAG: hypothetical protein QW594_03725 [Candidatus Woesearchaeota archaeon]